ncbi:copper chaperone PCu(A)C [Qipengyuania psychrotolerans]|uniref:Copper chaperone PCu(A)C n=1 Tax=Qipengyuania psychrotolerans TaxID=2867238 RepID=A0ABX8ZH07_9SPHN|nr:copper chaperone PCu(A)C [Qipengyuania psychrotolerans]QZD88281.1 copper chaperone PCu(A)C [Qipengyuania psychrotolerans]
MIKPVFAAALLAGSSLGLAACGGAQEETPSAATDAAGLSIANARMVLPAVEGNPAAIYFDLTNDGERGVAVRKVEVDGAGKTEVHATTEWDGKMEMGETGPQAVQAGDTLKFEPGGLHIMVFDLSPDLVAGSETAMTLTVAGGKSATFTVPIQAAGENR